MSLTDKDVRKVAKLSRLRVNDGDIAKNIKELTGILEIFHTLSEVDTSGVTEMTSVIEANLPMREDVVTDGNKTEDALSNAPLKEFNCYVVPKVVE